MSIVRYIDQLFFLFNYYLAPTKIAILHLTFMYEKKINGKFIA